MSVLLEIFIRLVKCTLGHSKQLLLDFKSSSLFSALFDVHESDYLVRMTVVTFLPASTSDIL